MDRLLKYHLAEPIRVIATLKQDENERNLNEACVEFQVDPNSTSLIALQLIVAKKFNIKTGTFELSCLDVEQNRVCKLSNEWNLQNALDISHQQRMHLSVHLNSALKDWDVITNLDIGRVATLASQHTQQAASNLLNKMEHIMNKTLNSLSQDEDWDASCPDGGGGGSADGSGKSVSDTAKRLMQLKLIKRQPSVHKRQDTLHCTDTLHLNIFLQSLLDRSVQQLCHSLGQSANWTQLAPLVQPLTQSQLIELYDSCGRVQNIERLHLYVFRHGVQPNARNQVWKHLLEVYPPEANWNERTELDEIHQTSYEQLRSDWQSNFRLARVQQVYQQIKKDVLRTDRTHAFFSSNCNCNCINREVDTNTCNECNNALQRLTGNCLTLANILVTYALNHCIGYWQGMSDMCAALLVALNDETATYVCFCALMKRLSGHFSVQPSVLCDQMAALQRLLQHFDPELFAHLQSQQSEHLLFSYRWLLLQLKREFPLDSALNVLEVIWASTPRSACFSPVQLYDQMFVPTAQDQIDEHVLHSPAEDQSSSAPLQSCSTSGAESHDKTDHIARTVRVWPHQMRNVMKTLCGNIENAMQPEVLGSQKSVHNANTTDTTSSGLGSSNSLSSTINQSIIETDEPNVEPSIELCDQMTLGQKTGPLYPLAFFNSFSNIAKNCVRPRRNIRFLPKILSNDSLEVIDSPDIDLSGNNKFVFPPKCIDKQISVDSIDSADLNSSRTGSLNGIHKKLDKHSNSLDDARRNASMSSDANELVNTKLPLTSSNSLGMTRRSINRAPPPLRLSGMVATRVQRSLPNSPLFKKKHDSFEKAYIGNNPTGSPSTSGVTASTSKGLKEDHCGDECTPSTSSRKPKSTDLGDTMDLMAHERADSNQLSHDVLGELNILDDDYCFPMSDGGRTLTNHWTPEVGLLDSQFSSFEGDTLPTSSPTPPTGFTGASMLRTSLDWRLRTNAFDRNVSAMRAATFASSKWMSRRTETHRQPSIGSLSSDSSTHSCDECEHERECINRRKSSTDDLALDGIVMVCGQGSQTPHLNTSLLSPSSPTESSASNLEGKFNSKSECKLENKSGMIKKPEVDEAKCLSNIDTINMIGCAQLPANSAFLLFTCLTLLLLHRDTLLRKRLDANEISVYFDRLIRKHDAQQVLSVSRQLFYTYLKGCQNIQNSFPA